MNRRVISKFDLGYICLWPDTEKEDSKYRHGVQRFFLTVATAAMILVARQPDRLIIPGFVLEDGLVFFADAFNLNPLDAILTRYSGYYHLLPRLVAELGAIFPFSLAPFVYSFTTLLLTALAISWFSLPHFRHIVDHDLLRLGFVFLVLLAPNLEAPMVLAYVQWFLALWGILIALMRMPSHQWLAWWIAICYCIASLTAPVLVITLPIWALRVLCSSTRSQRIWAGVHLLSQSAAACLLILFASERTGNLVHGSHLLVVDVIRALTYKVILLGVAGHTLVEQLLARLGWQTLHILAVIIVGIGLFVSSICLKRKRIFLFVLLCYILVASAALYAVRAEHYGFPFAHSVDTAPRTLARYFLIGNVALYLIAFVLLDEILKRHATPALKTTCGAIYFAIVILYSASFRLPAWGNAQWDAYAALLDSLLKDPAGRPQLSVRTLGASPPGITEAYRLEHTLFLPLVAVNRRNAPSDVRTLSIPITPLGWFMYLYVPNRPERIHRFREGAILLDVDEVIVDNTLRLRLFWQGNPLAQAANLTYYTAWVQLLDPAGNVIESSEASLKPEWTDVAVDRVFFTEHSIDMPVQADWEHYDLVAGLYHLADGQRIEGGSVFIEHRSALSQH